MASRLIDNLTSKYLDAATGLSPKRKRRRIVAYVEAYDDIAFWRDVLSEYENEERYFQVMLPSATNLTKGKKMVLMQTLNTKELGRSLIACVDSDYDFLIEGASKVSRQINDNPYVFQTYGYAIENLQCYAESLHEVCVQATLNDTSLLNFPKFMEQYSEAVYPLLLWNLFFYRQLDCNSFPMYELHECTRIEHFNTGNPYQSLTDIKNRTEAKLLKLEKHYPESVVKVAELGKRLTKLGLYPNTSYLYMQGHHIMDGVVLRILEPICTLLRRKREEQIRRLAIHNEQMENELTCYENSLMNVSTALRKSTAYHDLYLYQWIRRDVSHFLKE